MDAARLAALARPGAVPEAESKPAKPADLSEANEKLKALTEKKQ
jgi:hypothetical protein